MPHLHTSLLIQPCVMGIVFFLTVFIGATHEFSGYLQKVLKSQISHACDGDSVIVSCPHQTSVCILSAFYGRRVSLQNLCPSVFGDLEDNTFCSSPTVLQKMSDECQDRRSCHFSVNSRIFGSDPCPGTHKYLLVSYKCRPDNYKVKRVCDNEQLNLTCNNNSLLAIYSATYGRMLKGNMECETENRTIPGYECSAPAALRKVSRRCHHRRNCTIKADTRTFGDPCFPGVTKHLTVSYTCVPRRLLEEYGTSTNDPFALSNYKHGGWYTGPTMSRLTEDVKILTCCLELFALIQDMPEKVALYFLCGVSAGLALLLCIVAPKVTLFQGTRKSQNHNEPVLGGIRMVVRRVGENRINVDGSSDSSFHPHTQSFLFSNNIFSSDIAAAVDKTKEMKPKGADEIWLPKDPNPYAIQKIEEMAP